MTAYFIRRFLLIIPTFIGITLMVFVFTRFIPGGPVERMLAEAQQMSGDKMVSSSTVGGQAGGSALSPEQIQDLKKYYGFDQPVLVSYFSWLWKVVRLDLGTSSRYNEPVWDIMKSRFPISLFYGGVTMILIYLVCIPMGIFKAIRHKGLGDNLTSILVFIGYSIPNYVIGIGLLYLLASHWEIFPLGGFVSDDFEDLDFWGQAADVAWHGVLPILSYLLPSFAGMTFLMKNTMMDHLSADYVRTAMAKGLSFRKSVVGHALRNSLIPLATSVGNNISVLIRGSFLVETIFNIDGFGLLGYESVLQRDYPIVLGTTVVASILFLVGNIISDICVAIVDPRVQFSK